VKAGKKEFGLFYSLGMESQEMSEFGEAISYYHKALKLKGSTTLILNVIGECYLKPGETAKAQEVLEKSLEINPNREKIKKLLKDIKKKILMRRTIRGVR
jgi:tetratricopeptide (TPR) repeat protein